MVRSLRQFTRTGVRRVLKSKFLRSRVVRFLVFVGLSILAIVIVGDVVSPIKVLARMLEAGAEVAAEGVVEEEA